MLKNVRHNYDAYFKIMVIKHAEQRNNCETVRKYSVSKGGVWRCKSQEQKLKNASSTSKSGSCT
jgi:hypothetical protein